MKAKPLRRLRQKTNAGEKLEHDIKKLYLDSMERPQDIYYLDEMDIGWFFELMQYSDSGKNKRAIQAAGSRKSISIRYSVFRKGVKHGGITRLIASQYRTRKRRPNAWPCGY
nr:hypothetical protein P5648_12915 [Bacillus subtilis]